MLRPFQVGKARTSHDGPWSWIRASRVASQGPGKVAICTKCPNVPVAGIWLPAWTNAVAKHRATTWRRRTIATNRDFAGALPRCHRRGRQGGALQPSVAGFGKGVDTKAHET